MYCAHCGAQVGLGQRFCSKCGQATSGVAGPDLAHQPSPLSPVPSGQVSPSIAAAAYPSRLVRHLSVLGILWIVFSVLRLIPGVALMVFSHINFPFALLPLPAALRMTLVPFLGAIGFLMAGFAVLGGAAGWGLMTHQPWARMLAIVLGCISLIHLPFGTALGIYTLWVLLPAGADTEYRSLTGAN